MKNNFSKKSTTYFSIFFSSSRALRCVRNEIHTHLFVASILHNASWLLWYGAVIYRFDTIHMWTVWNSQFCYLFNAPLLINVYLTGWWTGGLYRPAYSNTLLHGSHLHVDASRRYEWFYDPFFFSISVPPMTLLDVRACPSSLANNWFFENYHSRSLFIHCIGRDICVRKTRQTRPLYAGMGSALLSHLGLSHRSWSFQ